MKRAQLTIFLAFLGVSVFALDALAQERRIASPPGRSATHLLGVPRRIGVRSRRAGAGAAHREPPWTFRDAGRGTT